MSNAPSDHVQHVAQAAIKAAPAIAPGAVTVLAGWLDVLNTMVSITFMVVSILFLLWRWRVAYCKQDD